MTDNLLGFTSYSNYPDVLDGALAFEPCWDLKPVVGVQTQAYLGILNQAPHPNAAKLFIQFMTTPEGADPWLKIGNYLPRTDIPAPEGALSFDEINKITWAFDDGYVYDNIVQARVISIDQPGEIALTGCFLGASRTRARCSRVRIQGLFCKKMLSSPAG
jgi:iron(III) transport system substrate-binding protein